MWIYTVNKFAKFHGNTLSLRENIAKSFRGPTFLTHTVYDGHSVCTAVAIIAYADVSFASSLSDELTNFLDLCGRHWIYFVEN